MSEFVQWVQRRLTAYGFALSDDGVFGARTRVVLTMFQAAHGLPGSGQADDATVKALRAAPQSASGSEGEAADVPQETLPPWAEEMRRRIGLTEAGDTAAVEAFLKAGDYLGDPRKLPWCGDAVESCFARTLPNEPLPNNPFFAQGWASFGKSVPLTTVGAVGVIRWSATSGHVGFIVGASGSRLHLLGGNQANAINIRSFPKSKFIAARWPLFFPLRSYASLAGDGVASAAFNGTR